MFLRSAFLSVLALLGCARGVNGVDSLDATSGAATADDSGAAEAGLPRVDSGQSGGLDGGSSNASDGGSPEPATCEAENACDSALVVSSVQGDTGKDIRMVSGTRSQWLSVKVTDTAGVGSQLSAAMILTSQGGADYDLFVRQPSDEGGHARAPKDCSATPAAAEESANTDRVALSWEDVTNLFTETDGDGLVLAIEVRHVSGPCGTWDLTIAGNE